LTILFCCILFRVTTVAQSVVVLDANTKDRLPYAVISFPQANKGLYADNAGRFTVPADYSKTDTATAYC
jgi:hypothetical protein